MKAQTKGIVAAKLVALIGLIFLTGCGSGGSGSSLPPIGNVPGGSGIGGGGCVPIQAPIPFSGQNIHFDHYNLVGGNLPPTDSWPIKPEGQVFIGGGTAPGGFGANQLYGTSMDGTIQMTVSPIQQQQQQPNTGYGYTPYNPYQTYSTRANVQGTLTLSAAVQQEIMYYMGGYNTQPNMFPQQYPQQYPQQQQQIQACANGVAFNMGYQVNMPYGKLYLYLNNTQHGITLVF